jgi:transketolase
MKNNTRTWPGNGPMPWSPDFLPRGLGKGLPHFRRRRFHGHPQAASGKVLNALAETIPGLMGGSADLAPSNNTVIKSTTDFQKTNYGGRNIRFGVREHAMAAIINGLSCTPGHQALRRHLSGLCRLHAARPSGWRP